MAAKGKFPGFESPEQNWSKLPHQLIDALPDFTSKGEIAVVLYILRHTWGFQEFGNLKRITLDEFMNGRKTGNLDSYPTGRLDQGVGMSKDAIVRGLKRAEADGFIRVERDDTDKARKKRYYMLRMIGEEPTDSMSESQTSESDVRKSDPDVVKPDIKVRKSDSNGTDSVPRSEKETLERTSEEEMEKESTLSPKKPVDYLQHCAQVHQNQQREGVWTVTPDAGGDSSLSSLLCNVFAHCSDIDPPEEQERQTWMRAFDKVLKRKKVNDPDIAVPALETLLDPKNEEFSYYTYANPTVKKFQDDYGLVLARFKKQDREDQDQEILPEEPYKPVYMPMPELKPKAMTEDERVWQAALGELQLQMTKATFETWVKNTRLISRQDGVFVIGTQDEHTKDWLENRLLTTIERTLVGIVGCSVTVKFEVST